VAAHLTDGYRNTQDVDALVSSWHKRMR